MNNNEVNIYKKGDGTFPPASQTEGMAREQLIVTDDAWVGLVETEPHYTSGWHHHGDYDTYIYVIEGQIMMEFGDDGNGNVTAIAGEVVHVPKHTVHRESNPGDEKQVLFGVRVGHGAPVFNVDNHA